ncbi:uncharacterized protein LOC117180625 [Belonocnema kinseyi]|uniref:uncharacterized protein LOC117180625 n=1 Tax=Belonocnema kinseyi TaxID=2817044 RepID=UPI00143DA330|nr:uncharacterized protein LOC117180625 [Belonocnema kinseyi]
MLSKYFPSNSELSTSLKLRSKEYLRENSLHGLPYLMDPSKRTYARVGWLICVLVSLVATIGTILTLWDKFQTSPTLMGIDILTDDFEIYFPNVFLCLNWELFPVVNNSKLDPVSNRTNRGSPHVRAELHSSANFTVAPICCLDVRFLSVNQRQCTFDDESVSYSYCERNCFINKIRSLCSCLPWFLAPTPEDECKPEGYSCLITARKMSSKLDCNCYLSCNHIDYNVQLVERYWNTRINISLYPWPHLIYKREISFGWVDLAVSFGGIAGFFLGFSVLTSFELWYYFTLRTYCGAVHSAPKKGISIAVKEAPKKLLKSKRGNYKNVRKEFKFFKNEFAN